MSRLCGRKGKMLLVVFKLLLFVCTNVFSADLFFWTASSFPSRFPAMSSSPLLPSPSQCQLHSSVPPAPRLSPAALWALQALLVFKGASQQNEILSPLLFTAFIFKNCRQSMQTADVTDRLNHQSCSSHDPLRVWFIVSLFFPPAIEPIKRLRRCMINTHSASLPDWCFLFREAVMWVIVGTACNLEWQLNDSVLRGSAARRCDTSQRRAAEPLLASIYGNHWRRGPTRCSWTVRRRGKNGFLCSVKHFYFTGMQQLWLTSIQMTFYSTAVVLRIF